MIENKSKTNKQVSSHRTSSKRYYEKNKKEINKKRREKYYQDNKTTILVKAIDQINKNSNFNSKYNQHSNVLNTKIRNRIESFNGKDKYLQLVIISKGNFFY